MAVLPFRLLMKDSTHQACVLTTRWHGPFSPSWRHQALRLPQCSTELYGQETRRDWPSTPWNTVTLWAQDSPMEEVLSYTFIALPNEH